MKTTVEYQKNYEDEIIVDDHLKEQVQIIGLTAGYEFDDSGECPIEMHFYDGLAVATDDSGLVMRYPTIAKVRQSEKMQRAIYRYTDREDINQFDIALKYGKLEKYKMVADYNLWVMQGDNEDKDIFGICTEKEHLFDMFEEDFHEMDAAGLIDDMEISLLKKKPTKRQLIEYRAKWGICWTEHFKDDILNSVA